MRHFEVGAPSAEAMRVIVRRIHREVGQEAFPDAEFAELEREMIDRVLHLSPRAIRLAMREAFGRALADGRTLPALEDLPELQKPGKRGPGFV